MTLKCLTLQDLAVDLRRYADETDVTFSNHTRPTRKNAILTIAVQLALIFKCVSYARNIK